MYTCWSSACYVHPLAGLSGGWGQRVTKHRKDNMLRNKTMHQRSTSQTRTLIRKTIFTWTTTRTGHDFWSSSQQVKSFPYRSGLPLLFKRVCKQLHEPWWTSGNRETALSWWSAVRGLKPETYFEQSVSSTDLWKYLSIKPWTPLGE